MEKRIQFGNCAIGLSEAPFVIAEMSGNHNQSLERALEIVESAARAGAHAIKLQTYTADTMTLPVETGDFYISDPNSLWTGHTLYDLYKMAYTPWEWHKPLMEKAASLGIICFSSPFDDSAVDFLERLNVPGYKVASFENTDLKLIEKVASTGKPMIISTGMATLAEIEAAVNTARACGNGNIILLKCTSNYPAPVEESNLRTIPAIREIFGVEVGLSDHSPGIGAAIAAVAMGATVIEKHFTLNREDGGVDAPFSLEPEELTSLVRESARARDAIGQVHFGPTDSERNTLIFRRTLYIARDLEKGDVLTLENVRRVRPGAGLPVRYLDEILGRKLKAAAPAGTPVSLDLLM